MLRYNSKYSGSQIDGVISYVLNGYPLAVGTGSLKASGSIDITGSLSITGSETLIGDMQITGSLNVSGGITGSLFGIATTASYFTTSSITPSASYALTASYINSLVQDIQITGSLNVNTIITGFNNKYNTITTRDVSDQIIIKSLEDKSLPSGDVMTSITLTPSTLTIQGGQGAPSTVVNFIELKTVTGYSTIDLNADYIRFKESDVEITGSLNVSGSIEPISGSSLILLSPNGTRFKLTVDNSGIVSSSLA